jgi:hypothetical protein
VAGSGFGQNIDCSIDGSQIVIGAKTDTVDSISDVGAAYVFERTIERFVVDDANQTLYTTTVNFNTPITVKVNDTILINTDYNIGGNFTVTGANTIDIDYPLQVGDMIEISINGFNYLEKLTAENPQQYSEYGSAVKICNRSCSVYVGVPGNNGETPQPGQVERIVNQARMYNTISATVANPVLAAGDSLRVNNINVVVPGIWSSASSYQFATVVLTLNAGIYSVYQALQDVPVSTPISDTDYWELKTTSVLAAIINLIGFEYQVNASVPNVKASISDNITIKPNGVLKTYSIDNAYQNVTSYTALVYKNDILQIENVDYTINLVTKTITFTTPPPSTADIQVVTGVLTLSLINDTVNRMNELQIGLGLVNSTNVYTALGLELFVQTQTILSPRPLVSARFGESISIENSSNILVIGAPRDSSYIPMTFDGGDTYFDGLATSVIYYQVNPAA